MKKKQVKEIFNLYDTLVRFDDSNLYDDAIIGVSDKSTLVYSQSRLITLLMAYKGIDDAGDAWQYIDDYKERMFDLDEYNDDYNLPSIYIPIIVNDDFDYSLNVSNNYSLN